MKKKGIIISMIAGIIILFLCIKPDDGSRTVSVIENIAMGVNVIFESQNEWMEQKKIELQKAGEAQLEQEEQVKAAVPEIVHVKEPRVTWNGKEDR